MKLEIRRNKITITASEDSLSDKVNIALIRKSLGLGKKGTHYVWRSISVGKSTGRLYLELDRVVEDAED